MEECEECALGGMGRRRRPGYGGGSGAHEATGVSGAGCASRRASAKTAQTDHLSVVRVDLSARGDAHNNTTTMNG